jgi:hypothetical protein
MNLHSLQFTVTCTKSSPVPLAKAFSCRLSLPLGSKTVPVLQPQQFSSNLHTQLLLSQEDLIPDWMSLYHPRRLTVHNSLLSKSKSRYDWWSVSQYVKVSSPLWNLWPDITFCPKVVVWKLLSCLNGALSLMRGRVCNFSFLAFTSRIYVSCVLQFSNIIYNMYKASFSPGSVQQIMLY